LRRQELSSSRRSPPFFKKGGKMKDPLALKNSEGCSLNFFWVGLVVGPYRVGRECGRGTRFTSSL